VEATLFLDKKVSYYKQIARQHSPISNSEHMQGVTKCLALTLRPRVARHVGFYNQLPSPNLVIRKI